MGALKTAGNGKTAERIQTPVHGVSNPQPRGRLLPGWVYWLIGLGVVGMAAAVAISTALVYGRRLETLQSRVDSLEQRYWDVETTMRHYVDERLRTFLLHQVSRLERLIVKNLICIKTFSFRLQFK